MSETPAHRFARLFSGADGKAVLDYLKTLTTNRVLPASCTDAELRFLEGQRFLVHVMETLIRQGKEQP